MTEPPPPTRLPDTVFEKPIQYDENAPGALSGKQTFYGRFKKNIKGVNRVMFDGLKESLFGKEELDEAALDDVEEYLLMSDVGVHTTKHVLEIIHREFDKGTLKNKDQIIQLIHRIFLNILQRNAGQIEWRTTGPTVVMLIGVNGSGKTTSIGKLSNQWQKDGKKILVAACDTFRAAAVEQLKIWAGRSNVDLYAKPTGSDPSSVAFEASQKALKEHYDVLICDTSGRLHTKKNLMDELSKMKRVIAKNIDTAPHYTILTLDGTSGQNAARQAKEFKSIIGYDGIILTKLDGTAKGGVIVGISNEFSVPVYYVGAGEKIDDVVPFHAEDYLDGLFATL